MTYNQPYHNNIPILFLMYLKIHFIKTLSSLHIPLTLGKRKYQHKELHIPMQYNSMTLLKIVLTNIQQLRSRSNINDTKNKHNLIELPKNINVLSTDIHFTTRVTFEFIKLKVNHAPGGIIH